MMYMFFRQLFGLTFTTPYSGGSYCGPHIDQGHNCWASSNLWSAECRTSAEDSTEQKDKGQEYPVHECYGIILH